MKLRVGILFGGESGEHEVSLASAASVLAALDSDKYQAVPIGITKRGQWRLAESPAHLLADGADAVLPDPSAEGEVDHPLLSRDEPGRIDLREAAVDVVFPVLHGPRGEDGTVQGLLELAGIPYVGSGVLASAVSMDKVMMKAVFTHAGLPGVRYVSISALQWSRSPEQALDRVESALPYPVFVKPCNMGSSVGISKAEDRAGLQHALDVAVRYDRRVIVEEGIDAREVEVSVLGNEEPMVSVPGEVVPLHEFYDYEAKYTDGLANLCIPANLDREQTARVQDLARRAFVAVDAAGLARVDMFVRRKDGEILVNEINTMPGFTATSMYPKLWEATGVPYSELIDRLLRLAIERHGTNQPRRGRQ